jgi:N-acetylmuramoyl-L-alanine amidase
MSKFQPIFLSGDYVQPKNHHVDHPNARQFEAVNRQCLCVVEFHFNSSIVSSASGAEVHYQDGDTDSKKFADVMWEALSNLGLSPTSDGPVISTAIRTRSGWIDYYIMPAIVLEPLFLSNRTSATWLHGNEGNLAHAIAEGIKTAFPDGGRIGLSAGHSGKSYGDPGAICVLAPKNKSTAKKDPNGLPGDCEAAHARTVSTLVGIELSMS